MSQQPTPTDDLIERQTDALEQGQQALKRSTMVPAQQAVQMQRSLGEVFLSGLEMNESIQKLGADLTRSAFRSYLDSFEDVVGEVSTQQGRSPQSAGGQQGEPQRGARNEAGARQGGQVPPWQSPQQPPPQSGQRPPQRMEPQQTGPQQTGQQYSPQQSPEFGQPSPAPQSESPPPRSGPPSDQQPPPQQPSQQMPPDR